MLIIVTQIIRKIETSIVASRKVGACPFYIDLARIQVFGKGGAILRAKPELVSAEGAIPDGGSGGPPPGNFLNETPLYSISWYLTNCSTIKTFFFTSAKIRVGARPSALPLDPRLLTDNICLEFLIFSEWIFINHEYILWHYSWYMNQNT